MIETLKEEMKPVLSENCECEDRNKSILLAYFLES